MLKETILKILASVIIIALVVIVMVALVSNYITAFKQGGVAKPNLTADTAQGYVRTGSSGGIKDVNASQASMQNMTPDMEGPPPVMIPSPGPVPIPSMQMPVAPPVMPPEATPTKEPVASPTMPARPIIAPSPPGYGGPNMPDLSEYQLGWQRIIALLYEMLARMFNMPYAAPASGFQIL